MESAALSPTVADHILRSPNSAAIVASYLKTVLLHDWWLIKVDANSRGKQLGVGGHAARKGQAIRTFHSAAIVKRHDAVTLETADGIKVTITGFINRSRTLERGFTLEVCNHFLFGFPDYWEKYTDLHSLDESYSRPIPSGVSWNDLPVTRVRDILMSSRDDTGNSALAETVLNEILHEYGGISCNQETKKQKKDNGHVNSPPCTRSHDKTPQKGSRTEIGEQSKDNHVNLCSAETEKVGFDKTVPEPEMAVEVNTYKRITRSQTVRKDREEVANVPCNMEEGVNSRLFTAPLKQNRNEAVVKIKDVPSSGEEAVNSRLFSTPPKQNRNEAVVKIRDVPSSGEEAVNSQIFTAPPKQNRTEAVVKIKDVGGSMCSSYTDNKGVREIIPEGEMSPDVNNSSRRVSRSMARKFHESAPPIRRSKRLKNLPK